MYVRVLSPSYEDPGLMGSGPSLLTLFQLHALFKDSHLLIQPILWSWGQGLQYVPWGVTESAPSRFQASSVAARRGRSQFPLRPSEAF